jgi:hypothetical protein
MTTNRLWILLIVFSICAALLIRDRLIEPAPQVVQSSLRGSQSVISVAATQTSQVDALPPLRHRNDFYKNINLNQSRMFAPQRPAPMPVIAPTVALPPPAPIAPALPFKLLGRKLEQGGWEIYLSQGDRIYVLHQDDMIDDVYKVLSIHPPLMTFLYLPLNEQQTLQIGADPNEE